MMNHASTPPKLTPPYTECSAQKTERRAAEGIEREHHIIEHQASSIEHRAVVARDQLRREQASKLTARGTERERLHSNGSRGERES
ncbi:hypothetical protein BcDW1_1786 [Botrytis cinerea BcDW1]|uniref:Uncharacterized protein n=1 Tax=Botryotinia fuckeliana (strain BcDW1) TaxID=1290391 RepID=M7URB6_BOTF1|nr:hypothetical protein BcDW1_1786 [Botrytis cinerea BcDW1]